MRETSKTFELVPSVERRHDLLTPMAPIPALPVRLQSDDGPTRYGVVDTGANTSLLSSSVVDLLGLRRHRVASKTVAMTGVGGELYAEVIKLKVMICDEDFSPWLRLEGVPFVVMPETAATGPLPDLVLGYDSLLANLRLAVDFVGNTLTVVAPSSLLASRVRKPRPQMPSRIAEGKNLIDHGMYDGAVALVAAGVEEAMFEHLGEPKRPTFPRMRQVLAEQRFPASFQRRFRNIWNLRNVAVHGAAGETITRDQAVSALHDAEAIVRDLHARASSEHFDNR